MTGQENRYFQALIEAVTFEVEGGTWCCSTAKVSAWSPTARADGPRASHTSVDRLSRRRAANPDDLIRQHLGLTCDHLDTYAVSVTDDDSYLRALADPTRRFLLDRLLRRDGRTLTELGVELEMTRFGVMIPPPP